MTETFWVTILSVSVAVLLNARHSEEQALRQRQIEMQAEIDRACGVGQ